MKTMKKFLHRLSRNPVAQRAGLIYKIMFAVNFAAAQPVVFQSKPAESNNTLSIAKENKKDTTAFTMNFQTTNNTNKANND
jgi:hypothetical protein